MILVATGLQREARIVGGPGVAAVWGGGLVARLEAALTARAPESEAILSFGLAGALAPGLRPGDCIVGTAVMDGETRRCADAAWLATLRMQLPAAKAGMLLGADAMLLTCTEKRAARARTDALAVDMESHVAARVAARFGLPFVAVRAISDAADRNLPHAVSVGLAPDGGMALWPVLRALARRPTELPGLFRAAGEAERAFRTLADARHLLGPGLGRLDLGELVLDVR
jgi:adenosylhomocysteine nucleosidase